MPIKLLLPILLLTLSWGGPLSTLCESGLKNHPKIRSKLYQEQSKQYLYDQGIDQYLPQISASAEKGYKRYVYELSTGDLWESKNFYSYTLSFRQPIYRPVLLEQIDDARKRQELAHLQTLDEKAALTAQIALTTVELLRLRQMRDLARKKSELYSKAYQQIQSTFKARFADKAALAQAKARLTQSEGDYARFNQMYRYTLNNLKFLTNSRSIPEALLRKQFNTENIARYYRPGDLHRHKKKIHNNTKVRIYKKYRDIAQNMIEMRRAEHYPTLDVKATYNDGNYGDPTDPRKNSRITLEVNLPIYQGGYVRDRVNEAQSLFYAASEDLSNVLLESRVTMEKYWEQLRTGLETLRALQAAEKAGKVYYETTLSAYKNGLQSLTDTYLANIDYYDAVAKRINAEAELLSAILNLYYVAGISTPKQMAIFEKRYLR